MSKFGKKMVERNTEILNKIEVGFWAILATFIVVTFLNKT